MKDLKTIANSINSKSHDINAEVIIADIMEAGLSFEHLLVKHDGQFLRNFSKDVSDAYADMLNDLLVLHVMRDSLYDILPSGLFHQISSDFSSDSRQAEFKKLKKTEENARQFFLPYNNEFFNQYVALEMELRKHLRNPGNFLRDLLLFDEDIAEEDAVKITSHLIYTDVVIGNPKLTALLLAIMIDRQVYINVYYSDNNVVSDSNDYHFTVGKGSLGSPESCGISLKEGRNIWEFTIILESDSVDEKFIDIENGSMKTFLKIFYEYFTPLEIEVITKVECKNRVPFYIGQEEEMIEEAIAGNSDLYLGYNTMI